MVNPLIILLVGAVLVGIVFGGLVLVDQRRDKKNTQKV